MPGMRITVLAGGVGVERDVSLKSGSNVAEALARLGHEVCVRDIGPGQLTALDEITDLFFVALHGEFGEDGQLQRILEGRGKPFTFSGSLSSEMAFDKHLTKDIMRRIGVPTADWVLVTRGTNLQEMDISFPAFLKPSRLGSSVDAFRVDGADELRDACTRLLCSYDQLILEPFIDGPEVTVGILGDVALPVCEIIAEGGTYGYEAKYLSDKTRYAFEMDIPINVLDQIRIWSLAIHEELGCDVLSRVDWRIDQGTGKPYALEINTIPGFTTHSLVPKAAANMGIEFEHLCQLIVDLSISSVQKPVPRVQSQGATDAA